FVGAARLAFRAALPPDRLRAALGLSRRCLPDARHLAGSLHIPRAIQRVALGAGARQPQLVVRPAQICAGQSGFPSLASHRHGTGRHEEFCGNLSSARFYIRALLYAKNALPDDFGVEDKNFPTGFGGQLIYPFINTQLRTTNQTVPLPAPLPCSRRVERAG